MPRPKSVTLNATVVALAAALAAAALAGCSSSSHTSAPAASKVPASSAPVTRPPTPPGPAARITGPITGGKGVSLTSATGGDLSKQGYREAEYFASGTATSYTAAGALGKDGHWSVTPKSKAAYRTRIVVRVPTDARRFNGTLLVEWFNVTVGSDSSPAYSYAADEITRAGFAWVGVSVQKIGVSGGDAVLPVAGLASGGLVGSDPARYRSLHHPGDQFAFDIFSQVARALRGPTATVPLHGLRPHRVIAIGESQSAFELTTYIDAIQPIAHVFDGFFVYSRAGGAMPIGGGAIKSAIIGGIRIRDDNDVPVLLLETETDEVELDYFAARQPDSQFLRLWDVAGAAHADAYVVGGDASILTTVLGCTGSVNTAPTHYVVAAALARLDRWVRTGTPPPSAPRMNVALVGGVPQVQRDERGNAIGGVRTAANDVPVATLSGDAPKGTKTLCSLFGATRPFDQATLKRLYGTKAAYLTKFRAATEKAIASGYVLPADRPGILADGAKVNF